ncbi:MAG TPA: nucleotidyltransferase domain-containing protein [Acetobacteraceae bacterium]|nr:nucleotidyltransferase domain-containing protein [Acetobacteraceae bacterium]
MGDTAFLSVRVPQHFRDRMKAIAAQRGENLQDLIGNLIARFLEDAERRPPELAHVVRRLRALEGLLRARHVAALWVFGSVARGDARQDSDVDLALEFAEGRQPSLLEIAHIKELVETGIGHRADIGERRLLNRRVAATAERDMVRVF